MLNLIDSVIHTMNKFARKFIAFLDSAKEEENSRLTKMVVTTLVRFINRFSYARFAVAAQLARVCNAATLPEVITNINLQQQAYAFIAGQRFSKRAIRKFASQGFDIFERRFIVIERTNDVEYTLTEETRYIWDRPTVLDMHYDKFKHLMLDTLSFEIAVDDESLDKDLLTRRDLVRNVLDVLSGGKPEKGLKIVNNTNLEQVVLFAPKSGASRIIYTTKKMRLEDLVREVAAVMGIISYVNDNYINSSLNFKVFSKIGVLLLRQGMPLVGNRKLKAAAISVPEADGVVAWFRPGVLKRLSKASKFNTFTAFQGTLVSFSNKLWAKGTFVEVSEPVWEKLAEGLGPKWVKKTDIILNQDALVGDMEGLSFTPDEFLVMKTDTDYKAGAQLSQQFVFYHWNFDNAKAVEVLRDNTKFNIDLLVKNASISTPYGVAVKMGLPGNLKVLRKDNAATIIKGYVRRLFTVDLSATKKGTTCTATSLPMDAFKAYIHGLGFITKGARVYIGRKLYPIDRIIIANVSGLDLPSVADGAYKVGVYKNPVTFTGDCPAEYVVINDEGLGSFAFMHMNAPHRVLSGHDFDGDDITLFSGEFLKCLRSCPVAPLAHVKLPEVPAYIKTVSDLHLFIALQYDAHIGMVERFADQIHAFLTGAGEVQIGDRVIPIKPLRNPKLIKEAYELIEFLFAQQQGVINAQKKNIEGLLTPAEIQARVDAFVRKIYYVENSKIFVKVDTFRAVLKEFRGISISALRRLSCVYSAFTGTEQIHKLFAHYMSVLHKWCTRFGELVKSDEDFGTAEVHIQDIRGKFTRWTSKVVGFSYRYIYQDWIYTNGLVKQYNKLSNNKEYWPRFYLVGQMFNLFMSMVSYVKRVESDREEEILSLVNVAIYTLGVETHRYIRNLSKQLGIKEEVCWAFLSSKVSDSAFFSIAPKNIVNIFVEHFNNLNENGRLHDVAYQFSNLEVNMELKMYCDGSYTDKIPGKSFWAYVSEDTIHINFGQVDSDTRQVAGECQAVIEAIKFAIDNGYDKVTCYVDYEGLIKWLTGEWQAKNDITKHYVSTVNALNERIDIDIIKIPRKDNLADKYCKRVMGLIKDNLES